MLSLKSLKNRADGSEDLLKESLNSYLAGFDSVARHLPAEPRELFDPYRRQLKALRTKLGPQPTRETMLELRAEFDEVAKGIGKSLDQHLHRLERDAKEALALTAGIASSMAKCDPRHAVRLKGVARKLRLLTTSTNLTEIRRKLAEEATQLRYYLDDLAREHEGIGRFASPAPAGKGLNVAPPPEQDLDLLYKARGTGR